MKKIGGAAPAMSRRTAKTPQTFRARLVQTGKTATGIQVPAAVLAALGGMKRAKVRVTVNRYTFRTSIGVMGARVLIGVSAAVRAAAEIAADEMVDVEVELDTEPRKVHVPPELRDALEGSPRLKKRFDALSFSRQQALALPIERGKTSATRDRNLSKAIEALRKDV